MPHMSDNYSGPLQFDDGSPRPAPGYSGASPNPPPSIGGALSWAWSAIKDNPIVLLVGFAVWMILCGIGVNGHYELNGVQHSYGFAWGAPITIVASLFSMIALAHVCLAVASGRRVTFTDFVTFPNFGQALLTSFLTYLAVVIGSLLCIIPGVAAAFLFFFARFIVVDRGTSAGDAMAFSYRILSANVADLFPFALVGFVLMLLGIVTVIGWILTFPLTALMSVYAYVRIQGRDVVRY